MSREEIWVTSKLWPSEYGEGKTMEGIDKMLERLDIGYIDGHDIIGTNQRKPSKIKGLQMI